MSLKRVEILIDDERHRRITALAEERGVPVSVVIREAIDRAIVEGESHLAAEGRRVLAAEDTPVPETAALLEELDAIRGRRE